jgi:ATP/maltotriose-dependent transcriptional regulator MalT
VWRLAGPLTSTPRLVELVESRVAALSAQERGALELLAVCGALGLDELVGVTGSEPVEALDRAGLLAIVQDRRRHEVGVAHPLHGEVLREQLPALRRRRLLLDHADRVEHLGARRREDALRIANARLEGAGTADAGLLVGAARLARYGHDHRQVVRLAQAAMDESPTPEAALLLGEALHEMGRYEEAEAVLARHADVDADIDEHVLVPLVAMRVRNHFWGLQRPDDALALNRAARARFASPARDELAADEAMLLVFTDHARDALEAAQSIPLDAEPRIRVLRGIAEVPALIFSGRCETALPLTMERYADHVRLGDQVAIAHPAVQLIYRMRAFMEAGNLDAAREIATAGHQTVSDVVPADRVWFTLGLGWIDVLAGHPVSARRWLTEAAAMCRGAALAGQLRVVLSMLAVAEAYAGDAAAASAAVAEQQDLGPFAYMRGEQELGPAWATAAAGDTRGARELLTAAADEAEVDGRLAVEAWLRHDVARLGDAPAVAARLEELAKVCEGAFVPAYALDARGAADHDPILLAGARDRFEAIGADLLAAEAAATAALAYRRHGDQRAAAGMATRANVSKDRCEGGHTPALVVPVAVVPLTAREREVALLAANGMSSREIAERLVVSVRTVDNHLQSTYTKLGISGRGELADALGATSG